MDYYVKNIGNNRRRRLWLQGPEAMRAGFAPGDHYEIEVKDNKSVVLTIKADGKRKVSSKKRKRKNGEEVIPIIDIENDEILKIFEGMDSVRMIARPGSIVFLPLASELHRRERTERLLAAVQNNEPLRVGSLSHGGGIMCHAIHKGLEKAGFKVDLKFAVDIAAELLEHAAQYNDAWNKDTSILAAPLQELVQDEWFMEYLKKYLKLHILDMSLPCSGASRAGRAKRGLEKMEDHPDVGHLAYAALRLIQQAQPAVIICENVVPYKDSGSAQILRLQLRDMGYDLHEAILNGKDWGALEHRVRWCLVGVTRGMKFDFDKILPDVTVVRRLGDVLDPIPWDDPRWSEMKGLVAKEVRDLMAGKNFRMQVFDENSPKIHTITKGYSKVRSTDPKVRHPLYPQLMRQLTAREHARVKGVPPHLLGDGNEMMSESTKHAVLGQGIVYDPFVSVGQEAGEQIANFVLEYIRAAATHERALGAIPTAPVKKRVAVG